MIMKTTCYNRFKASLNCLFIAIGLVLVTACNKGDDIYNPGDNESGGQGGEQTEDAQLKLIVSKKGSLLSQHTWNDGNTLGLFLTEGVLGRPYLGDKENYSNVKAYMWAGSWLLTPQKVQLTEDEAVIYAYSPYIKNVDPFEVPIETEKNIDYMVGKHHESQKSVDIYNNTASLEMQHVLSLIQINVRKNHNFKARALLQEIALESASDSRKLPVKGTLDIMTAAVTPNGYGSYQIANLNQVLPDEYRDSCSYHMMVLPRENKANEVFLSITVNGNRMSLPLNDENDWKQGVHNTYNVVFDGSDMRMEKVEINPWKEINIEGEIEGR